MTTKQRIPDTVCRTDSAATIAPAQTLQIAVVFTSVKATLAALRKAGELADRLGAHIDLIVPQVVPYPLRLERPAARILFSERRFRILAQASPVDTAVHICLCRDPLEGLSSALTPQSLVVIAGRQRWWRRGESELAAKLRRVGHEVVFLEME